MRLIKAVLIIMAFAIFSACSIEGEGFDEMKKARSLYSELISAEVTVTDALTGEAVQKFKFRYEGKLLTYYYHAIDDEDNEYFEYHNGSELFYGYKGDSDWSVISSNSKDYYFYSTIQRHPMSDYKLLFFEPQSMAQAEVIDLGEDIGLMLRYNTEKMSVTLKNQLALVGELSEFETYTIINKDGYPKKMTQSGVLEGEPFSYEINIERLNELEVIEKPDFPT